MVEQSAEATQSTGDSQDESVMVIPMESLVPDETVPGYYPPLL